MIGADVIDSAIDRHSGAGRIALQFSGGKDSIATLLLMAPHWHRLTVYWLNTGDAFPQVVELAERVRSLVPNFVEVKSSLADVVSQFGLPSDVRPHSSAPSTIAIQPGFSGIPIQDRFECCFRTIMLPMNQRMIEDGITLIVRGQRAAEKYRGPLQSGQSSDGFEVLYPIEDWLEDDVADYITSAGWEIPSYYTAGVKHSGDCMTCPAWLGDGRSAYLKQYYPEKFEIYKHKLAVVASAAQESVNKLIDEVTFCSEV